MTLRPVELRDPSLLIRGIADQVPLLEGMAYVVLIKDPSTTQRIVHVRRLRTLSVVQDHDEACSELRDVIDSLPIPPCAPGAWRHLVLTVVVRRGLCVVGPNEGHWLTAWLYSNHAAPAFTGDLILVTEHGWRDWSTDLAGTSPARVTQPESSTAGRWPDARARRGAPDQLPRRPPPNRRDR